MCNSHSKFKIITWLSIQHIQTYRENLSKKEARVLILLLLSVQNKTSCRLGKRQSVYEALWTLCAAPYTVCLLIWVAKLVTSHMCCRAIKNKLYRGRHTFISVHRGPRWQAEQRNIFKSRSINSLRKKFSLSCYHCRCSPIPFLTLVS